MSDSVSKYWEMRESSDYVKWNKGMSPELIDYIMTLDSAEVDLYLKKVRVKFYGGYFLFDSPYDNPPYLQGQSDFDSTIYGDPREYRDEFLRFKSKMKEIKNQYF